MPQSPLRICILLKPGIEPEQELAFELEKALVARGHKVQLDRQRSLGIGWAQRVEDQLRHADLVLVLLTQRSVQSEMLAFEVELADALSSSQEGWPRIVPVRLQLPGVLPPPFDGFLREHEFYFDEDQGRHRSRQLHWKSPADDAPLLAELDRRMAEIHLARTQSQSQSTPAPRQPSPREPVGGAVPLDSKYYLERPTDSAFREAVQHRESLVLVKGARQMGKTSLLARGLQTARDQGARVVLTDFQKLPSTAFQSYRDFLIALSELAARQLQLDLVWQRRWNNDRAPNVNFEDFWRRDVLGSVAQPTVWAIDELDRIFASNFGSDFCGLLRAWHNERALDPSGPWREFTVAIAYATEVHLFIRDLNQSPFNVGTRLALGDFNPAQLTELNRRHGQPLTSQAEVDRLYQLIGGHPFLARITFNSLAESGQPFADFAANALEESGPYGDHLQRLLLSVIRSPALVESLQLFLHGAKCPSDDFFRLRSAGVLAGTDATSATFRCTLYQDFLRKHLPTA